MGLENELLEIKNLERNVENTRIACLEKLKRVQKEKKEIESALIAAGIKPPTVDNLKKHLEVLEKQLGQKTAERKLVLQDALAKFHKISAILENV